MLGYSPFKIRLGSPTPPGAAREKEGWVESLHSTHWRGRDLLSAATGFSRKEEREEEVTDS